MDLSQYLETMKNLPDRFSNLAFWRGVRNLRDKLVETFEYIGEWGTWMEGRLNATNNNLNGLHSRLDDSFTVVEHTINVTRPSNLLKMSQGVPESSVPYPRVDNFMVIFTVSDSSITDADIIESASFSGLLNINNTTLSFREPRPLIPIINGSTMHFILYTLPMYMKNGTYSIGNGDMTLYIRCRKIATK